MDPEDRELLLETAKLAEENHRLLLKIRSTQHWGQVWGFVKVAIIIVPFIIGFFYLQPYLGSFGTSIEQFKDLVK